ncbi:SIT4-associating protein [Golovinomyces cichoracearum]|uniref:SIT4-associating protein n=1 Tax=Golovinomyces cichoracearum TaxID=62708 RepID=A0A420IVN9_9PEZI|nr:SIT4-associating protein [Golovinomyces cichoracearum]
MFWRYGGFANVSTIDTLLEKSDVTLDELLDEPDLIQELRHNNTKLLQYLCGGEVLERLLEYVIAPANESVQHSARGHDPKEGELLCSANQGDNPEDNDKTKQRNRYAYVAAEVLSSENWPICESLMDNQHMLKKFWEYLKLSPPLESLQASYFTKVNEALLDKKTQEMLLLFKSCEGVVKDMLRHVDSPMIMDLLLKIISLERVEGGQGIVDWLHKQDLMPTLISFIAPGYSLTTQTSAGDFLKAVITISANTSQVQQPSVGPNELTRQLVSQPCVEKFISYMLNGGNSLTVAVGIVIEIIRKNNSDYDPCTNIEDYAPSSQDPIYLGTLLRLFAQHVPDFMNLIFSTNHAVNSGNGLVNIRREKLNTAFGQKIEPLGFDRFKICELMAELLHCSNMRLLNEADSEEIFRRRDIERERLRAEGQLETLTKDSAMNSSTTEEVKTLHIQNVSDDDGFERVSYSGYDDTNDFGNLEPPNFMERNDEYFLDGSLSPRLKVEASADTDLTPSSLSPVKGISKKIDSLGLEGKNQNELNEKTTDELSSFQDNTMKTFTNEGLVELNPGDNQDFINTESISKESENAIPETKDMESKFPEIPLNSTESEDHPSIGINDNSDTNSIKIDSQNSNSLKEVETDTVMKESEGDKSQSINVLFSTRDYPIVGDFLKMQFLEYNVIPTILDFFFRFPWNNFLHNVVYDVVQQVFNGPMERGFNRSLAFDLFETGNITMRIVNGQRESDEMSKMRLGYMGHLTLIAEEVVKFTERHPPKLLPNSVFSKIMNSDWISYVEVTLAETRERDNAILGGFRPIKSSGQRPAGPNFAGNFGTASADPELNRSGLNEEDDEMAGTEVGPSVPLAPIHDKLYEQVDYEYFEKLDRETPLSPEGRLYE